MTGGNSGIGFEIARWLLRKNAKVYIASRSEQRANVAIKKFKEEGLPGDAIYMTLDLGSLVSIKKFVISFLAREQRLDLLFNNGGITNLDVRASTHPAPRYDSRWLRNEYGNQCSGAALSHAAVDSGAGCFLQNHARKPPSGMLYVQPVAPRRVSQGL